MAAAISPLAADAHIRGYSSLVEGVDSVSYLFDGSSEERILMEKSTKAPKAEKSVKSEKVMKDAKDKKPKAPEDKKDKLVKSAKVMKGEKAVTEAKTDKAGKMRT